LLSELSEENPGAVVVCLEILVDLVGLVYGIDSFLNLPEAT